MSFCHDKRDGKKRDSPVLVGRGSLSHTFVLFSGRHAPANVALGLVLVQYCFDLQVQRTVKGGQPVAQILVYCGFRDSEFPGGGPDGGFVFDNVKGQVAGPLFHIPFHSGNTPPQLSKETLCGGGGEYERN